MSETPFQKLLAIAPMRKAASKIVCPNLEWKDSVDIHETLSLTSLIGNHHWASRKGAIAKSQDNFFPSP